MEYIILSELFPFEGEEAIHLRTGLETTEQRRLEKEFLSYKINDLPRLLGTELRPRYQSSETCMFLGPK